MDNSRRDVKKTLVQAFAHCGDGGESSGLGVRGGDGGTVMKGRSIGDSEEVLDMMLFFGSLLDLEFDKNSVGCRKKGRRRLSVLPGSSVVINWKKKVVNVFKFGHGTLFICLPSQLHPLPVVRFRRLPVPEPRPGMLHPAE